jgi:hypothetical protein
MLTSRLERCYNSANNGPTHAPGFQIDYPPPTLHPSTSGGLRPLQNGVVVLPLGKEVPPPLPPKMFINTQKMQEMLPPQQMMVTSNGRPVMMTGSGFVLGGKMGTIMESQRESSEVVAGTWSGGLMDFKSSSLLDSHDRYRGIFIYSSFLLRNHKKDTVHLQSIVSFFLPLPLNFNLITNLTVAYSFQFII